MKRRRQAWLCLAALHLALVTLVGFHSTAGALVNGRSFVSPARLSGVATAESVSGKVLLEDASAALWPRAVLDLYLDAAGIDAGYGYFAPNVSENCRLMFQLKFPGGHTEISPPIVGNRSSGLRLMDLLDRTLQVDDPRLREHIIRTMASSVWLEYPDALEIRAVFGTVQPPSINGFKSGERETYHVLFGYDFARTPGPSS